ncbi:efflux RND transporter permease subunit [Neorhodopirellula lusitana]|uniref:efflux RND transporter permease subunit n=1 Tax=Neorhodopirellula lusitana TaxID=445327 RepID=UPI00384C19BE
MNLPEWSVRNRTVVLSAIALLMVWGTITFFTMPRREDPEFTIRVCVVSTVWPGATATKVEELITDKIEQEVISLEEVEKVRSFSRTGQSTVFVELNDDVAPSDIQNVWDKVRARVDLAEMPEDSVRPVVNDEFGDTAVMLLAVHQTPLKGRDEIRDADVYSPRQLEKFAERIEDDLRLVEGVAKVEKYGVRNEAIYIETNLGNWAQLNLTTAQLKRLASERNIVKPGGQVSTDAGFFNVRPGGEFDAVEEIEHIAGTVRSSEGDDSNNVYLSDLGLQVSRDYEDPPSYLCRYGDRSGSEPAVMVAITMKSGSNIIEVCGDINQRLDVLMNQQKLLPPDIAATPVSDQSLSVNAKISDVIVNVIEAVLIVVVVVYVLVGFRIAFVMAANIPVVVIGSIGLIAIFGVQLEQISLAAIIISLGLLVDNAVQVCDQARSNQIDGMKPFPAAVAGAQTLAVPMLMGTLTTMAAFVPMLFCLEGGGKEYVYSLPVTVSTTLALSWVLAMTLCVVLAGVLIRPPKPGEPASPVIRLGQRLRGWLPARWRSAVTSGSGNASNATERRDGMVQRIYGATLMVALRWKWSVLFLSVFAGVAAFKLPVSSEFFPEAANDLFGVKIYLPETATIEQTNQIAKQVEGVIRSLSEVSPEDSVMSPTSEHPAVSERLSMMRTIVGGGASRWSLTWEPEPPTRNFAEIMVRLTDGRYTKDFVDNLRIACRDGDPERGIRPVVGARVVPIKLALGPPADPLVFRIIGSGFADPAKLRQVASEVQSLVREQPEAWNVYNSWGINGFQMQVDVDRDRATLAGVTNSQIAETLNSYYSGLKLTTFREGDHQVPIYFRLKPESRTSVEGLRESFVEGDLGKVPLDAVADFRFSWQPEKIQRRNMNRVIEVSSRMLPGVAGNDVVSRLLKSPEMAGIVDRLPPGFWIEPGGAYEESQESGGQMMMSFLVSFVLISLLLVFHYNSLSKTLMILFTLPLALVTAWIGLSITDNALGFMPQLGILALFGIVLNTAIIFIEFADQLIDERIAALEGDEGKLDRQALWQCFADAGKQRLLPIFLTTSTTIGGLLPLALVGGPLWIGLAWCMIVGLSLTTLLTLYLVPVVYAILVETFGVEAG